MQTAAVRHCEDYALWSAWIRFFKPGMIEEILFKYHITSSSTSSIHAARNNEITQRIRSDFINLDINDTVPAAIESLATALEISPLQAGVVAFRLWHYGNAACLPEEAVLPLAKLMPDRTLYTGVCEGEPVSVQDLLKGFGSPDFVRSGDMVVVRCI